MIDTFLSNSARQSYLYLARGKHAGVDNIVRLLRVGILVGPIQRRAGQRHETGTGGLEDAKGSDELEERVYPGRLGGPEQDNPISMSQNAWRGA